MLLSAYFGFVARIQAYQISIYVNLHDDKSMEVLEDRFRYACSSTIRNSLRRSSGTSIRDGRCS